MSRILTRLAGSLATAPSRPQRSLLASFFLASLAGLLTSTINGLNTNLSTSRKSPGSLPAASEAITDDADNAGDAGDVTDVIITDSGPRAAPREPTVNTADAAAGKLWVGYDTIHGDSRLFALYNGASSVSTGPLWPSAAVAVAVTVAGLITGLPAVTGLPAAAGLVTGLPAVTELSIPAVIAAYEINTEDTC
ncbi:hypothetical protein MY3296_010023 [Beauveria thailandica]